MFWGKPLYQDIYSSIYIYIYIVQSTDTCFTVLQLVSVAWNNLNEFHQTLAHTIVRDYRMWDSTGNESQSAQTSTRVVNIALLLIGIHGNFTECSTTPM